MVLRIRPAAKTDPVSMSIGASADGGEGRELAFREGRVIPVYYDYPEERRGYILRSGGKQQATLPNISGKYEILLAVREAEVERLKKAVRKLREKVGALEEIPRAFWPQLGMILMQDSFCDYMSYELYVAVQKKYSLLMKLNVEEGGLRCCIDGVSIASGEGCNEERKTAETKHPTGERPL